MRKVLMVQPLHGAHYLLHVASDVVLEVLRTLADVDQKRWSFDP